MLWMLALGVVCLRCVSAWAEVAGPAATGAVVKLGFGISQAWGVMDSRVRNTTDKDLDALLAVSFDIQPDIQFASQVWVPPHAFRQISVPVRFPRFPPGKHVSLDGQTLLLSREGGIDRQLVRETILVGGIDQGYQNAVISETEDEFTADWVSAILHDQVSVGGTVTMAYIAPARISSDPTTLSSCRTLFYTGIKGHLDAGQRAAVRSWLIGGGHLILIGQRLDLRDGALLLGADWGITEVGRTELDDFSISTGKHAMHIDDLPSPGELVRVLAPGWDVHETIDGWPVELRKQVGRGVVSLITCSPEVFMDGGKLTDAGRNLASRLQADGSSGTFGEQAADADSGTMETVAAQLVSYPVVNRGVVMVILGVFAAALGVVGTGLSLRHKLEWIAPVGLVASAGAAGVLIYLGASRQLPLTVAGAQAARVVPSQHAIVVNGEMDIFSPDSQDGEISSTQGGQYWPELKTQGGSLIRLVSTDVGAFHYENLKLPSGAVLKSKVSNVLFPADVPTAVARFGPEGLSGSIHNGVLSSLQDMVLHARNGDMAAKVGSDGSFRLTDKDTLAPGAYIAASLLSEVQRQRQEAYRSTFAGHPPTEPILYGWSEGGDWSNGGVKLGGNPSEHAVTLAAIPVRFERVPAGTAVHIPAAVLPYEVIRGVGTSTLAYDSIKGRWMSELTSGTRMSLKFNLPPSVLPLAVDSGILHVNIRAPGRTVELLAGSGAATESIDKRNSPGGAYDLPLSAAQARVQSDGSIRITVDVNTLADLDTRFWEVHSLSLEVSGHVLPAETPVASAATRDP